MLKLKLVLIASLVALLAAIGAGWKWGHVRKSLGGDQSHLIAGWSWGGDIASAPDD
jgi:hypothetical protein